MLINMISRAGVSIFLFGNKLNDTEIVFANGMKQEFEIAVERHNLIVPVGCTGYVAHEIWNTIKQDMSSFYTNDPSYSCTRFHCPSNKTGK